MFTLNCPRWVVTIKAWTWLLVFFKVWCLDTLSSPKLQSNRIYRRKCDIHKEIVIWLLSVQTDVQSHTSVIVFFRCRTHSVWSSVMICFFQVFLRSGLAVTWQSRKPLPQKASARGPNNQDGSLMFSSWHIGLHSV